MLKTITVTPSEQLQEVKDPVSPSATSIAASNRWRTHRHHRELRPATRRVALHPLVAVLLFSGASPPACRPSGLSFLGALSTSMRLTTDVTVHFFAQPMHADRPSVSRCGLVHRGKFRVAEGTPTAVHRRDDRAGTWSSPRSSSSLRPAAAALPAGL